MQEHFGQNMNLARIKLMSLLLHALCVVQTVSLHKLADAMPTAVDKDSNLSLFVELMLSALSVCQVCS